MHENSKLKPWENMLFAEIVSDIQNNFCTQHVLLVFCKKKNFLQRFTCTDGVGCVEFLATILKDNDKA